MSVQNKIRRRETDWTGFGFPWVTILILGSLVLTSGTVFGQSNASRIDEQFLRQLTERRFFGLAEQHCVRERNRARHADDQARWQLRLSRTYLRHAWFAESANRGGLLTQSIQQLRDFLAQQTPSPALEFQLRLQQIETLLQSVRMALITVEGGRLFGEHQNSIAASVAAGHLPTVSHASELATSLATDFEAFRKQLDVVAAQRIRDTIRLKEAELSCLRWRLSVAVSAKERETLRDLAIRQVEAAARASFSQIHKHRARWLRSELALFSEKTEAFDLRVGAIRHPPNPADFSAAEFLQIRSLLAQQDASAAAEMSEMAAGATGLQIQQFEWLKLESLLGVRELFGRLDEPDALPAVGKSFRQQAANAISGTEGVFRDAAEATIRRFDLVEEVGVAAADLVEKIDVARACGQTSEALTLTKATLALVSSSASFRAKAALELRAGQLLLELQHWSEAISHLSAAITEFAQAEMTSQQAVADLLRIFALAKLWESGTQDSDRAKANYQRALDGHLESFSDQTTVNRIRDWLITAVASDDPCRAASVALDMSDDATTEQNQKIAALHRAGRLMSPLSSPTFCDDPNLRDRFREALAVLVGQSAQSENPVNLEKGAGFGLAPLRLLQLEFDVKVASASGSDWPELRQELVAIPRPNVANGEQADADAPTRRRLLQTVIAARLGTGADQSRDLETWLEALPLDRLLPAAKFLASQLNGKTVNVGDIRLARTFESAADRLFIKHPERQQPGFLMRFIPDAIRAANVTGETELRSRIVSRLLATKLSDAQMNELAVLMTGTTSSSESLKTFWTTVVRSNPQGSDAWLEAKLQLAQISATSGEKAQALRQLSVIDALYPEWGTDDRRKRMESLRRQLNERGTP